MTRDDLEKLYRWVATSVNTHFEKVKSSAFPMVIEGFHREFVEKISRAQDTRPSKSAAFFECRQYGPRLIEHTRNDFTAYLEVNILITNTMSGGNLYLNDDLIGKVVAQAMKMIPVYGENPEAPEFCFTLRTREKLRERLEVHKFGQVSKDIELIQSTVEGHYIAQFGVTDAD